MQPDLPGRCIGAGFIVVIMLSGLLKVRRHLSVDPAAGMLRLCLIVVAVLFNDERCLCRGAIARTAGYGAL
jgi:hypothetical protein